MIHHSSEAKITKFAITVGVEEDITWFQVSMQNLLRKKLFWALVSFLRAFSILTGILIICVWFISSIINLCGFCSSMAVIKS